MAGKGVTKCEDPQWLRKFLLECDLRVGKCALCKGTPKTAPYWSFGALHVKVELLAIRGQDSLRIGPGWRPDSDVHAPTFLRDWACPLVDVSSDVWKSAVYTSEPVAGQSRSVVKMRPELAERMAALDAEALRAIRSTESRATELVAKSRTDVRRNARFVRSLQKHLAGEGSEALDASLLKAVLRIDPLVLRRMASFILRQRSNIETLLDDDVDEAVRLAKLQDVMDQ